MFIISKSRLPVQSTAVSSAFSNPCHSEMETVLVHKRYIDETQYFVNNPLTEAPYHKIFVSLPGTGKTTYVCESVRDAYDKVVFFVDTKAV